MGCRREISYEKIRSKRCCAFQRLCSYPAAVTESSRTFSPSAGGTQCQAQRCTFTSPASFQTRSATGSLMVFAAVRPQNVTANSLPKKKKKKESIPKNIMLFAPDTLFILISKNESWMSELFKLWQILSVMPGIQFCRWMCWLFWPQEMKNQSLRVKSNLTPTQHRGRPVQKKKKQNLHSAMLDLFQLYDFALLWYKASQTRMLFCYLMSP